jgi:hypothetical protein
MSKHFITVRTNRWGSDIELTNRLSRPLLMHDNNQAVYLALAISSNVGYPGFVKSTDSFYCWAGQGSYAWSVARRVFAWLTPASWGACGRRMHAVWVMFLGRRAGRLRRIGRRSRVPLWLKALGCSDED